MMASTSSRTWSSTSNSSILLRPSIYSFYPVLVLVQVFVTVTILYRFDSFQQQPCRTNNDSHQASNQPEPLHYAIQQQHQQPQQEVNMMKYKIVPNFCNATINDKKENSTNKFDEIYSEAHWGPKLPTTPKVLYNYGVWPPETNSDKRISASGGGSNLGPETQASIAFLSTVINEYNITTMIDIPCGDTNWIFDSYETDVVIQLYIGLDIVSDVIQWNQQKYVHHSNKLFAVWDGAMCPLPKYSIATTATGPLLSSHDTGSTANSMRRTKGQKEQQQDQNRSSSSRDRIDSTSPSLLSVDLIHSRDVLQHLPQRTAIRFLCNVFQSNAKYFITTTFPNTINRDIAIGDFYLNNLDIEPFNIPRPTSQIKTNTTSSFESCIQTHPHHEPDLTCLYDLTQPWVQEWITNKCV